MKKTFLTLAIAAFIIAGCNQTDKKVEATNTTEEVKTTKAVEVKSPVLAGYLAIGDALAKDDAKAAAEAAIALADNMNSFDESSLSTEQKAAFLNIKEDALEHAEHIGSNGDNIDHQREHFKMLSENMYTMAKNVDPSQTFYKVTCPMYKEGSSWLSTTKDVINPYYGASMLNCGSVEETIN
jgi:PBP1b-binding outer membrane lipoprotein LpoB